TQMLLMHDLMSGGKITNPVFRATYLVRVGIETGNGKRETGNGKRETGNGKRETGNFKAGKTRGNKKGELMLSFS
ncbi:hypothetical protein KIV40_09015, partial [Vibrio sp. D173a]|uniref:hypothetical protein n=1 Tax=Vibrio sp. D173a TaxID=2836349 RepID=UPI0025560078